MYWKAFVQVEQHKECFAVIIICFSYETLMFCWVGVGLLLCAWSSIPVNFLMASWCCAGIITVTGSTDESLDADSYLTEYQYYKTELIQSWNEKSSVIRKEEVVWCGLGYF